MQHCCCAFTYDLSNHAETKSRAFGKMRFCEVISICMTNQETLNKQLQEQRAQHSEKGTYAFVQDSKIICEYIKEHGILAWRKLIG